MANFKTSSVIFVGLVFVGVGVYYGIRLGLYPVAMVNGSLVSAGQFDETENFIRHYYEKAQETYNVGGVHPGDPLYEAELARATLDQLIGYELIYGKLKTMVGADLSAVVDQKLASASANASGPDFAKAVETVYGLSLDRFRERVLVPQAREEILRGRLFAQKRDFDAWFLDARKTSKVIILYSGLVWDGEKVVAKK